MDITILDEKFTDLWYNFFNTYSPKNLIKWKKNEDKKSNSKTHTLHLASTIGDDIQALIQLEIIPAGVYKIGFISGFCLKNNTQDLEAVVKSLNSFLFQNNKGYNLSAVYINLSKDFKNNKEIFISQSYKKTENFIAYTYIIPMVLEQYTIESPEINIYSMIISPVNINILDSFLSFNRDIKKISKTTAVKISEIYSVTKNKIQNKIKEKSANKNKKE